MTAFVLRTVILNAASVSRILRLRPLYLIHWTADQCLVFDFAAFAVVPVALATTSSSGHIP